MSNAIGGRSGRHCPSLSISQPSPITIGGPMPPRDGQHDPQAHKHDDGHHKHQGDGHTCHHRAGDEQESPEIERATVARPVRANTFAVRSSCALR